MNNFLSNQSTQNRASVYYPEDLKIDSTGKPQSSIQKVSDVSSKDLNFDSFTSNPSPTATNGETQSQNIFANLLEQSKSPDFLTSILAGNILNANKSPQNNLLAQALSKLIQSKKNSPAEKPKAENLDSDVTFEDF